MSDSHYLLLVRPMASARLALDRGSFGDKILRIPGVAARETSFTFGTADEHGIMEIAPVGESALERVEIRVPRPWVMERGPQVFALVFMMAEWSAAEVFDPQIDAPLQKEAVLQGLVAVRQAQKEAEAQGRSKPPVDSSKDDYVPTTRSQPTVGTPVEEDVDRKPWWKKW